MTILKICSHFSADPKCVDKFFLDAIFELPKIIMTIKELLKSLKIEKCLQNTAFSDLLKIQQRNPALSTHSCSPSELYELIDSNKIICELIARVRKPSTLTFESTKPIEKRLLSP